MKKLILLQLIVAVMASGPVVAADFGAALAARKISVTFRGTGGSSGDSVEVVIGKTAKNGPDLELTLAPGTLLRSASASAQNMVIAGVKGQVVGPTSYSPSSVIQVENTPKTYVLEAYCTDFEKDNPSSETAFTVGKVDPILACILSETSDLSPQAKQAAVWIYTDKASYSHVNEKFTVSRSDWDAAEAIVKKCSAKIR